MHAEKFELLEAKIRETATLVVRLRQEKWQLEQENAQLRERVTALVEEIRQSQQVSANYAPSLDSLLSQLDTLHHEEPSLQQESPPDAESPRQEAPQSAEQDVMALQELIEKEDKGVEDYFYLGTLHEQNGQFDQAIHAYQRVLEAEQDNLEVAQRLAFLLEKLNRDAEAAPLWDKIWAMREAQSKAQRRRLR